MAFNQSVLKHSRITIFADDMAFAKLIAESGMIILTSYKVSKVAKRLGVQ